MHINVSGINPFEKLNSAEQHSFDVAIFYIIMAMLNVTPHLITNPLITDLQSYERDPNIWVVEQMIDGSANISSNTVILFPQSVRKLQYSLAIGTFRPEIFFKVRSVRQVYNIYTLPFPQDVWLTLLSILLTITVVLTFILGRETRLPHDTPYDIIARIADEEHDKGIEWSKIYASKKEIKYREHWELAEILLVTLGAFCLQGPPRDPSTLAARIVLLSLFILAISLYTSYSASVISLISLLPHANIESHEGWAIAKNNRAIVQDSSYFRHNFSIPLNDIVYTSIADGIKPVVSENKLLLGDRDSCIHTIHQKVHSIASRCSIGASYLGIEHHRVFAFRKEAASLLLPQFNLKLRENGVLKRQHKRFFKTESLCNAKERGSLSGFTSITLMDIEPLIHLFLCGNVMAILLLLIEHVIFYLWWKLRELFWDSWKSIEKSAEDILRQWTIYRMKKEFLKSKRSLASFN